MSDTTINISEINIYFDAEQPQQVITTSAEPFHGTVVYETPAPEANPTPSKDEQILEKFIDAVRGQFKLLVKLGFLGEDAEKKDEYSSEQRLEMNYHNLKENFTCIDWAANIAIYSALALYDRGAIKL